MVPGLSSTYIQLPNSPLWPQLAPGPLELPRYASELVPQVKAASLTLCTRHVDGQATHSDPAVMPAASWTGLGPPAGARESEAGAGLPQDATGAGGEH